MTAIRADVLLAEDDSADAELILASLGEEVGTGRVHVAHDGEEALDFVFCRGGHAGRAFDAPLRVVILDIKLTKVTGLEVLRQLKHNPRTRSIPVVLLTSSNVVRDIEAGYRFGANSYVQKPVDFAEFRDTVRLLGVYWLTVNVPPPVVPAVEAR